MMRDIGGYRVGSFGFIIHEYNNMVDDNPTTLMLVDGNILACRLCRTRFPDEPTRESIRRHITEHVCPPVENPQVLCTHAAMTELFECGSLARICHACGYVWIAPARSVFIPAGKNAVHEWQVCPKSAILPTGDLVTVAGAYPDGSKVPLSKRMHREYWCDKGILPRLKIGMGWCSGCEKHPEPTDPESIHRAYRRHERLRRIDE